MESAPALRTLSLGIGPWRRWLVPPLGETSSAPAAHGRRGAVPVVLTVLCLTFGPARAATVVLQQGQGGSSGCTTLVEHDDVVEQLAAQRAAESLDAGLLRCSSPRTATTAVTSDTPADSGRDWDARVRQ
jgi:hypothetical protein